MERRQNQRWYDKLSVVYTLMGVVGGLCVLIGFFVGMDFRIDGLAKDVAALEECIVPKEQINQRFDNLAESAKETKKDVRQIREDVKALIRWTNER